MRNYTVEPVNCQFGIADGFKMGEFSLPPKCCAGIASSPPTSGSAPAIPAVAIEIPWSPWGRTRIVAFESA